MSRIGKSPIELPKGVEIAVSEENVVRVKGPKGTLFQPVNEDIAVKVEENQIILERPTEQKRHKAMHGLYRALVANAVQGVTEGYTKELELVGVGYKATSSGQKLDLNLGYSHGILVMMPEEVKVSTVTEKGKNPIVKLESIDKQLLGEVAAKIRSLRKVEPYKGKGVRCVGEQIRRKAGKTAAK